jgi:hypothetical protein
MKIKSLFNATLGITMEVLYALCIMLVAFFICVALYFKK